MHNIKLINLCIIALIVAGCSVRVEKGLAPHEVEKILEKEFTPRPIKLIKLPPESEIKVGLGNATFDGEGKLRQSEVTEMAVVGYGYNGSYKDWWVTLRFIDGNMLIYDVMKMAPSFNYSLGELKIICNGREVLISGSEDWVRGYVAHAISNESDP